MNNIPSLSGVFNPPPALLTLKPLCGHGGVNSQAEALLNAYEASRLLALAHPSIVHDSARVAAAPGQAHVWDRCRAAAPRIARTCGIVLDKAGRQCHNTAAVDEAMRSTRAFWQDSPVSWDDEWEALLNAYTPPPFGP